eukprot:6458187-Amphidinium_carterae.1
MDKWTGTVGQNGTAKCSVPIRSGAGFHHACASVEWVPKACVVRMGAAPEGQRSVVCKFVSEKACIRSEAHNNAYINVETTLSAHPYTQYMMQTQQDLRFWELSW